MLKHRIITAVILVAVLLAALLATNPIYWQVAISIAILGAFFEWLRFCRIEPLWQQLSCFVVFAAFVAILKLSLIDIALLVPLICGLWGFLMFFTFYNHPKWVHQAFIKLIIGVLILAVAGWLIIELKKSQDGTNWVLGFFLTVIAADVGAYFFGKRFGKTKLAPSISPGKTVEGFIGGLVTVGVVFTPILFTQFDMFTAAGLLLTSILTAVVSVGGDLFESKLKRHVGLKDSSQILPGHGGILDRVDSLMAGIPVFMLGLLLLEQLG